MLVIVTTQQKAGAGTRGLEAMSVSFVTGVYPERSRMGGKSKRKTHLNYYVLDSRLRGNDDTTREPILDPYTYATHFAEATRGQEGFGAQVDYAQDDGPETER